MLERLAYDEINRIAGSDLSRAEKFAAIHRQKLWARLRPGNNREGSVSGWGSSLDGTCLFRPALEDFLRETGTRTLFDAPCGDLCWMQHVAFDGTYIGGDIVPELIDDLKRKFPAREFVEFDIITDPFPDADVWLCRACMWHLTYDEINQALDNFRRSSVKIALLSNSRLPENYNIRTGDSRLIDLTKPPFNLPPPRRKLPDHPGGTPTHIGVWHREDLT